MKFSNNADTTFNVEFVSAHLAHPEQVHIISPLSPHPHHTNQPTNQQPSNILMNLTGMIVNRTVNQHETVNVEYAFAPVREINPQDYNLVIGVHFVSEDGDSNERDSLTAFNGTVSINDGTSAFDLQGLFLAVLIGGGFFFAYNKFTGGKKTLKVSTAAAPAAARTATSTSPVPEGDIDLSYVDATLHKKATRTRSGSPAKKN